MRAILGLLLAGALLAGCANAEKPQAPIVWASVDGRAVDQARLAQAKAVCKAEAIAAAANETNTALAYDSIIPQVDFSPLGTLPEAYEAGVAARRRRELQEGLLLSAFTGCMARNGYITQQ